MATQDQQQQQQQQPKKGEEGERKGAQAEQQQAQPQQGQQVGIQRSRGGGLRGLARPERRRGLGLGLSPLDVLATSPFDLMRRLTGDMSRMFGDFGFAPDVFAGWEEPSLLPSQVALWSPQIEVRERGNEIVVRADLPGLKKEDLNIEVVGNNLVISGERRSEEEREEPGYYRSERTYGSFERVIALPEGADIDNASASYKDGVLMIKVKQPERQQGRRIEIEEGERTEKEVKQVSEKSGAKKEVH